MSLHSFHPSLNHLAQSLQSSYVSHNYQQPQSHFHEPSATWDILNYVQKNVIPIPGTMLTSQIKQTLTQNKAQKDIHRKLNGGYLWVVGFNL